MHRTKSWMWFQVTSLPEPYDLAIGTIENLQAGLNSFRLIPIALP